MRARRWGVAGVDRPGDSGLAVRGVRIRSAAVIDSADGDDRNAGPEPVPISSALDRVLRSMRAGAGRAEVGGVFGRWEDAVGPTLARHVRPIRLDRGVLLVEVDDPAWATHVRFLVDDLRQRLRTVAGVELRDVEVRVAGPRGRGRGSTSR